MSITRRQLIGSISALGAVSFAGIPNLFAQNNRRFRNKVAIPPLLNGVQNGDVKRYDLKVIAGNSEFFPGVRTPTIGINGPYLGPTIKCSYGDKVDLRVQNSLNEPTTLHWHGVHLPAKFDGGPHQAIRSGDTWSANFSIKQKASTCWYHSHLLGRTGEQVLHGLAGLFLIGDDEASALKLPLEYGVDDIPLVIQDRRFNRDGSFQYSTSMPDTMMGYHGDTILVNGTVHPYLILKRRQTRLRILNGSNARFYNLGRSDGKDLVVIASDGSLLSRPVKAKRLRLAPGERAELLIDADVNQQIAIMSYPDRRLARRGMGPGMMMGAMMGNNELLPIIGLRAGKLESSRPPTPSKLINVPSWSPGQAARTRVFNLDMGMMGGMGMGRGMIGGMGMGRRMRGRGRMDGMMGINGREMDPDRIDVRVPLDAIEIWEIRNSTPLPHPFHIHDIQFRVLSRNNRQANPHEAGLKDTVIVDPGETVRVITQFTDYADSKNPYMYHCHILEHEDAGMMGQFTVVA